MNKLIILTLALFATLVQGSGLYSGGPLIQRVPYLPNVNLPQVQQLLGGSAIAAASSPAQVYAAKPLLIGGRGYGRPSVAYAPVRSVVAPSVRGYGVGPVVGGIGGLGGLVGHGLGVRSGLGYGLGVRGLGLGHGLGVRGLGLGHGLGVRGLGLGHGLGVRGLGYGSNLGLGYGARRFAVQPAIATQLTGGLTRYKTYQSPPLYSTVALPVIPSAPVAKLFVPKRLNYGVGPSYGIGPVGY